jgi:hypothetical protein
VNDNGLAEENRVETHFKNISDVTMNTVKLYYLELLKNIDDSLWEKTHIYLSSTQKPKFRMDTSTALRKINSESSSTSTTSTCLSGKNLTRSASIIPSEKQQQQQQDPLQGVYLTTKDAHTLTDGPTIYLTEDVTKIGNLFIQLAKIPEKHFSQIMEKITENNKTQKKIDIVEKALEDKLGNELEKEKKMEKNNDNAETNKLRSTLEQLQSEIKTIYMNPVYVPNQKEHQEFWTKNVAKNAFAPTVEEQHIKEIMLLDVPTNLKLLLLLGIGVFSKCDIAYGEIMKKLAYQQRLYLIIASSDYIYGTNYQFCHGFVGKDLLNMTQQKTIQAMGRIGRNNVQNEYTVRFRDDAILRNMFLPVEYNLEAVNMCKLFCSE